MNDWQIVEQAGLSYGIRNKGGFVLLFCTVQKFEGQDERYQEELRVQRGYAEILLKVLKKDGNENDDVLR